MGKGVCLGDSRVASKCDGHKHRDVGSTTDPEKVVDELGLCGSHNQASTTVQVRWIAPKLIA
jgi:hypothetical protein